MEISKYRKSSVVAFGMAAAVLLVGTMFADWSGFVETELLPKWYIFVGASMLLTIIMACRHVIRVRGGIAMAVAWCIMAYFAMRTLSSPLEQPSIIVICIAAFVMLCLCFNAMPQRWNVIFGDIVIVVCVGQGIYGMLQYAGLISPHSTFPMVGSFDNPAGFSACLVAGFPFCLKKLPKNNRLQWGLVLCGRVVIPVAIVLSGSRGGVLSVAVVSALCLYGTNFRMRKSLMATVIFAGSAILLSALFFLKQDSSFGRLQIWEVSIGMIREHPLFGGGAGSFLANYMPHQAAFFAVDSSNGWPVLADNVSHPLNEYLLILTEYGIVGLSLLLLAAFVMLRHRKWTTTQGLCLWAIGVFACFSYPLRYPFSWVIIAYAIATINYEKHIFITLSWALRTIIICLIGIICFLTIRDIKFEAAWGSLTHSWSNNSPVITLEGYRNLYYRWNGNPYFLYNYGRIEGAFGHHAESNRILAHCIRYLNDYDVQMAIGDNYNRLGETNNACQCYETALLMCPNRFLPLYQLMELNIECGNEQKAYELAEMIVANPVKIESPTIHKIKIYAEDYLNKYKSFCRK